MQVLRRALDGKGQVVRRAVNAAASLDSGPFRLPGPTGESNRMIMPPKGPVLCMGPETGAALAQAAQALHDRGASKVIAAATHPIFSGPAAERLNGANFSEIIVTNTLPIRSEESINNLKVLSIAPLIAKAINAVFLDGSVTSLFGGVA